MALARAIEFFAATCLALPALAGPVPRTSVPAPREYTLNLHLLDPLLIANYYQSDYALIDPVGDYALAFKAAQTPAQIAWTLVKSPALHEYRLQVRAQRSAAIAHFHLLPQAKPRYADLERSKAEIRARVREEFRAQASRARVSDRERTTIETEILAGRVDFEGRRNPFRTEAFADMLKQVILEESKAGIEPRAGEVHRWSPEFMANYGRDFFPFTASSKLLVALARGETANYLVTGRETDLENWLVAQPIESVWPSALFRTSYRLNRGDVYLSILTIENVLARWWLQPNRQFLETTRRLHPIINQLGMNADQFGAWYHLYGIMLFGYAEGAFNAQVIGNIEALGSAILSVGEPDLQEDFANSEGGKIGQLLARALKTGELQSMSSDAHRTRPEAYLDLSEDYSGQIEEAAARLRRGGHIGRPGSGDSEVAR